MSKFFSCLFFFVSTIIVSFCVIFSLPISSQEKKEKNPWELKTAEVKIDAAHNPAVELTRKFVKSPEGKKFLDWTQGLNVQLEGKDYPPYSDEMIKVLIQVVVKQMQGYVEPGERGKLSEQLTVDYFFKAIDTAEKKKSVLYFMLNYYLSVSRQVVLQDIDEMADEMDHQKLVIHSVVGVFLSFVPDADQKKMEIVKKGWEKAQGDFFKRQKGK